VKFPRPRDRKAVLEHPDYYRCANIITFLGTCAQEAGGEIRNQETARPRFSRRPQFVEAALNLF
jgi:hypothetical protein